MHHKSMKNNEYEITEVNELLDTQDMGLAVALIAQGYELTELRAYGRSNRVTFRFEYASSINNAAQEYWNGRMQVDAKTYWNEMKNLKTRLYSL